MNISSSENHGNSPLSMLFSGDRGGGSAQPAEGDGFFWFVPEFGWFGWGVQNGKSIYISIYIYIYIYLYIIYVYIYIYTYVYLYKWMPSWWFGTWIVLFHSVGNFIIPIDFHIFQRGWNQQPDDLGYLHVTKPPCYGEFGPCSAQISMAMCIFA